jgi:hypothetical protein
MPDAPVGSLSVAAEVSQLFRTKRVSEIRAIEANIRAEAEDRAINLNTLLGTRYHDLLAAVDAVVAARDAAQRDVRDALAGAAADANRLRAEFLARSRAAAAAPVAPDLERRRETSAVGTSLLHIVDSPEILYACLEQGNVFGAAVRFVASEKAHAELDKNIAPAFAEGRWALVEAFRPQILAAARERIATRDLDTRDYADVMATVVLLTRNIDVLDVVSEFLSAGTAWIDASLDLDATDHASANFTTASGRMRMLATIIHDLVVSSVRLFLGDDATLAEQLKPVDPTAALSVAALDSSGAVGQLVRDWLAATAKAIGNRGVQIAEMAKSARDLADALAAVRDPFMSDTWTRACSQVLCLDSQVGVQMFLPLISERSKTVAQKRIQEAAHEVVAEIQQNYKNVSESTNLGEAVWSAVTKQAVQSDHEMSQSRDSSSLTQTSTGPAAKVVCNLELAIGDALDDVSCVVEALPEVGVALRVAVSDHLPAVAVTLRNAAATLSKEEHVPARDTQGNCQTNVMQANQISFWTQDDSFFERALFVARTASALSGSKMIATAFTYDTNMDASDKILNARSIELQSFREALNEATLSAYKAWAGRLCSLFGSQLRTDLTAVFALELQIGWCGSGRKDGPGQAVETPNGGGVDLAQYPCTPSAAALRFAMAGCMAASNAGGFALPHQARSAINGAMRVEFTKAYEGALETYLHRAEKDEIAGLSVSRGRPKRALRRENVHLQLMFDVTYLSYLLLGAGDGQSRRSPGFNVVGATRRDVDGGEPASSLADDDMRGDRERLDILLAAIQTHIDPINLATVGKQLNDSAKTYLSRSLVLLGALTIPVVSGSTHVKPTSIQSGGFQSANVSAIAPPVGRFPYLPAPMPSTYSGRNGLSAGITARAAGEVMSKESIGQQALANKKREESIVVDYASKITENVGRFGKGLFESWRGVGQ